MLISRNLSGDENESSVPVLKVLESVFSLFGALAECYGSFRKLAGFSPLPLAAIQIKLLYSKYQVVHDRRVGRDSWRKAPLRVVSAFNRVSFEVVRYELMSFCNSLFTLEIIQKTSVEIVVSFYWVSQKIVPYFEA